MTKKQKALQNLFNVRDILKTQFEEGNKTNKMRKVEVGELWVLYDIICEIFEDEHEKK